MNKKIFFALSVAVVAIAAIGTVSAFDLTDIGSLFGMAPPDQTVTIDGENFTIPGTFKENDQVSNNGTVNDYQIFKCTTYSQGYINDTNYINVIVFDYDTNDLGDNLINYLNGTSKDISGVKGYMYSDDNGFTYTYAKENKVISIQSDDEALIAPVIA